MLVQVISLSGAKHCIVRMQEWHVSNHTQKYQGPDWGAVAVKDSLGTGGGLGL